LKTNIIHVYMRVRLSPTLSSDHDISYM